MKNMSKLTISNKQKYYFHQIRLKRKQQGNIQLSENTVKRHPHTLLVGGQFGITLLEGNQATCSKNHVQAL